MHTLHFSYIFAQICACVLFKLTANVFLRVPYVGYNVFHRQHKEIQIVEFVEQSIQPRGGPFFCGVRVKFNCAGNIPWFSPWLYLSFIIFYLGRRYLRFAPMLLSCWQILWLLSKSMYGNKRKRIDKISKSSWKKIKNWANYYITFYGIESPIEIRTFWVGRFNRCFYCSSILYIG